MQDVPTRQGTNIYWNRECQREATAGGIGAHFLNDHLKILTTGIKIIHTCAARYQEDSFENERIQWINLIIHSRRAVDMFLDRRKFNPDGIHNF